MEALKAHMFVYDQTGFVMAKGARLFITKNVSIHPLRLFLLGSGTALDAKREKLRKSGLSVRLAPLSGAGRRLKVQMLRVQGIFKGINIIVKMKHRMTYRWVLGLEAHHNILMEKWL